MAVAPILCIALAALLPRAFDSLPPGTKSVQHSVALTWDSALEAYDFYLSPIAGFWGIAKVERGEPLRFSSKYGSRIWALPAGTKLDPAAKRIEGAWPRSPVPVSERKFVSRGKPLASIVTHLAVVAVDEGGLRFEVRGEQRFDAAGREFGSSDFLVLLGVAGLGALLIAFLYRRQRDDRHPAAEPC